MCVVAHSAVSRSPSLPQSDALIPGEGRRGEEGGENVGRKGRERDGGKLLLGIVAVREIAFKSLRNPTEVAPKS